MRVTFTAPAAMRAPPSESLARTLISADPPFFDDARTESFTARITYGLTTTVTVASLQLFARSISHAREVSDCGPLAVPPATELAPLDAFSVTPGSLAASDESVTRARVTALPS